MTTINAMIFKTFMGYNIETMLLNQEFKPIKNTETKRALSITGLCY